MNEVKLFSLILNIIWILGLVASTPNTNDGVTEGFEGEGTDGTMPVSTPTTSADDGTTDGIGSVNTLSVEDQDVTEPTEPPYDCEAELYEKNDADRADIFHGEFQRTKRFIRQDTYRNRYLPQARITYNVLVYPEDADPAAVDRVVDEAFTMWADHTFKRFTRVRSEEADLSISFIYGKHSRVSFENGGFSKADTPKTFGQAIFFNGHVNWSFEPTTDPQKFEFKQRLLRDIGFGLGLDDSDQAESIMFSRYRHNFTAKLYPDDIKAIQSIFGTRNCKKHLAYQDYSLCRMSETNPVILSVRGEYFFLLFGRIFTIEEREKPKHFSKDNLWLQIGEEVTDGFLKTNFNDAGVHLVASLDSVNRTTILFTKRTFYVYHWDSEIIEGPKNTSAVYGIDVDVTGVFMFPNDPEIYFSTREVVKGKSAGVGYVVMYLRKTGGKKLKHFDQFSTFMFGTKVYSVRVYNYYEITREQFYSRGLGLNVINKGRFQKNVVGCNTAPLPGKLEYRVIPPYEPSGKDDVCNSNEFDALVTINGSAHVFRYDRVYKLVELPVVEIHNKSIRFKIAPGYPKYIRDEFPGLPDNIDAAVAVNGTVYFFQGRRVWLLKDGKISAPEFTSKYFRLIPHPLSAIYFEKNNTLFFQKRYGWNHYLFINPVPKYVEPFRHFGYRNFRTRYFGQYRDMVFAFSYDSFIPINGTTQKVANEFRMVSFEAFGEIITRNRSLSIFRMDINKDLFGC